MPVTMPEIKYLTRDQVKSVISNTKTLRDRALLAFIYNCGMRRAEIQFITRDNFHPTTGPHGMIQVPRLKKGGDMEWHEILLWKRTAKLLRKYLRRRKDSHCALFLSRKHVPISGQGIYYAFKKAAIRAGIPRSLRSPKSFRHSIAVHHFNHGADPVDVQALLGHRNLSTTLQYARVLTPRKERMTLASEVSRHFARF